MSDGLMICPNGNIRIDCVLWTDDGQEVARYITVGETLELALDASQLLSAPHIAMGLDVQVVRVGYWCPDHGCYHDATKALLGAEVGADDFEEADVASEEAN